MDENSERTRLAEALRIENQRSQRYLDAAEVILLGLNRDGLIDLVNRTGCRVVGYERHELIGKNWAQVCVPEKERESVCKVFRKIVTGAEDFSEYFKNHILSRSGKQRLISWHNAALRDVNGAIIGTLSSGQDITELRRVEEALRKLSQAVEQSSDMILITDTVGKIEYVNPSFSAISGFTRSEAIGRNPSFLKSGKTPPSVFTEMWDTLKSGGIWRGEVCNKKKDGELYWNLVAVSPILNAQGVITHFLGIQSDITARKQAEERLLATQERLRASEERYRICYDSTPAMFFTVDSAGEICSANRFGAEQLGYQAEELVGMPVSTIHLESDKVSVRKYLETCLNKREIAHRREICAVRKDGTLLWVREAARAVPDSNNECKVLMVCEDITEARNLSQQLSFQASHDALTGLVNRREFERRLHRVLETARTDDTEHALCYLDLDQFKVINDTCGHAAGDELLRQLARLLQEKVRQRDTLARLGGDEFGIVLEHCSLKQAARVANSLRESIEDFRLSWQGKNFSVGSSIGLVPITRASKGLAEVLSAADSACYRAKEGGRNRIHVYRQNDGELAQQRDQMQWVAQIKRALEHDLLQLYFQPIVSVKNRGGESERYEFLVRMTGNDGRPVPPGAFIPAAERYNLACKLDRWVISTAFRWLHAHPRHLERLSLCSINLSGFSLGEQEMLRFVHHQSETMNIPLNKVCFEVTETAAISNFSSATCFIRELKQRGCWFALDDFGSGMSSFAYLKKLPVDLLKIDGLFVRDILDDPIDLAMVSSINEIGHVMGKQTIAEFVENEAILEKLGQIGVDYAQGYGIAHPMALEEMTTPCASN